MNKQNYDDLEKNVEQRALQKEKRKKKKMKVSGAGVKQLQSLIRGKAGK